MSGPTFVDAFGPVAITDRSGHDESVHHGAVVALASDGTVSFAIGDPDVEIYPRSANKPIQADALLRIGLVLGPHELAVACASHDGTPRHVNVVRRILAAAGVGEEALRNTPDLPIHRESAELVVAAGGHRTPILMNCSGKHAAMIAASRANGWESEGYLATDHPVQIAITAHIADLAGAVAHIGIDGCGAPAHVVALRGLAAAHARLAVERGEVWQAMTKHPDLVGGLDRDVTRLMATVPGLMAKDGAEGVFAAALPDGRAAAVKIADGNARAAGVVLAAALRQVGVDADPAALGPPILGHGRPVGRVRPAFGEG